MQILEATGIEWRERRLVGILCLEQCVKLKVDQEEARSVKTGRGIRQGCCLSLIILNVNSE